MKHLILVWSILCCYSVFAEDMNSPYKAERVESQESLKEPSEKVKAGDGDTYNFYFNKKVKEKSGKPSREEQSAGETQATKKNEIEPVPVGSLFANLGILGSASGYGIGAQYNLLESFGLMLEVEKLSFETESSRDTRGVFDETITSVQTDAQLVNLGFTFAPSRSWLASRKIHLYFGLGVSYIAVTRETSTTVKQGVFDESTDTVSSSESKFSPTLNVGGLYLVNDRFGIGGYARAANEGDFGQIGVRAAFVF